MSYNSHEIPQRSSNDPKQLINKAMAEGYLLYITYRDRDKNETKRTIEPLEWVEDYKIRAFCHLAKDERHFVVSGILEIRLMAKSKDDVVPVVKPPQGNISKISSLDQWKYSEPTLSSETNILSSKRTPQFKPDQIFSHVQNSEQWQQLISYYAECLNREYLQDYLIDQHDDYRFFPADEDVVLRFLAGGSSFSFPKISDNQPVEIAEFITSPTKRDKQLCIGYPSLITPEGKIVPLFFTPCEVVQQDGKIILYPDEYQLNYAILYSLDLDKEEFAAVVTDLNQHEFEDLAVKLKALQDALVIKLENLTSNVIPRREANRPSRLGAVDQMMLFTTPCLFWASKNNITSALIEELEEISKASWNTVPKPLLQLLNISTPGEYPNSVPLGRDNKVFMTPINDDQRQASHAALSMPITVVTGPPGTGKSQLVVNIIANAVLDGKSVLFASRNNQAVDVVVKRIQTDMHFDGLIRTGSRNIRKDAADVMLRALSKAAAPHAPEDLNLLVERYKQAKTALANQIDTLNEIQRLKANQLSKSQQLEEMLVNLPQELANRIKQETISISQSSIDTARQFTKSLIRNYEIMQHHKTAIESVLQEHITDNGHKHPLVTDIENFEMEWGRFGHGVRDANYFTSLETLQRYVELWTQLLDAVEARIAMEKVSNEVVKLDLELENRTAVLPTHIQSKVSAETANEDELRSIAEYTTDMRKQTGKIQNAILQRVVEYEKLLVQGAKVQPKGSFIDIKEAIGDSSAQIAHVQHNISQIQVYMNALPLLEQPLNLLNDWVKEFLRGKLPSNLVIDSQELKALISLLEQKILSLEDKIEKSQTRNLMNLFGLYRRHQANAISRNFKSLINDLTKLLNLELKNLTRAASLLHLFRTFIINDFEANQFIDSLESRRDELAIELSEIIDNYKIDRPESMTTMKTIVNSMIERIDITNKQLQEYVLLRSIKDRRVIILEISSRLNDILKTKDQLAFGTGERIAKIEYRCKTIEDFLTAIHAAHILYDKKQELVREKVHLAQITNGFDEKLQSDFARLKIQSIDPSMLKTILIGIAQQISEMLTQRNETIATFSTHMDNNSSLGSLWAQYQNEVGKDEYSGWRLDGEISISVLQHFASQWLSVMNAVEMKADVEQLETIIQSKGGEEGAIVRVATSQQNAISQAIEILNIKWLQNINNRASHRIQRVRDYASLIQEVYQNYDKQKYGNMMSIQDTYSDDIIATFPVWATTNLSISRNLPLKAEMFDVLIMDEASQCDIPSALPLIYRAKQVVIIGDAMQLRHIATLTEDSHQILAAEYNIATEAYSYTQHSLFDLALRSVGQHPGVLMLREHYRSHENIISFSNQTFYDGKLVIKTDMTHRKIPTSVLERGCGIFWLNVSGETIQPRSGSAKNLQEHRAIQQALPAIYQQLEEIGWDGSIGIVTPYREQRNMIQGWVDNSQFGQQVTVGTAHTFQGDERDILLFSTVLAPGISEGSLAWLKRTSNLLNVAVTRARTILIIVGDFNFCMSLPDNNPYKQLAEYVRLKPQNILQSWEELPVLSAND